MNKEITIYELLGLIKDGQAPKKIKLNGYTFKFQGDDYLCKDDNIDSWLFSTSYTDRFQWLDSFLNAKVEIIEEDKKIEKIKIDNEDRIQALSTGNYVYKVNQPTKNIIYKINELIDEIEKLKEVK